MQTNLSNQTTKDNLQEQKRQQIIQSWYEPALKTLDDLLEKRRENLRNQNREEKNAAVKREEFKEALARQHRITYNHAEEIIKSLGRAGRIRYLGSSYIQLKVEESK